MENIEWFPFFYNGLETNVEVTKEGNVRRVLKDWHRKSKGKPKINYGSVNLKDHISPCGYYWLSVSIKGNKNKSVRIHQMVASVFLGYVFNGNKNVVDHIDSNKLNNNLYNLRIITNRENISKEISKKTKYYVGVYFHKPMQKYRAQIHLNGKRKHLGYFNTPEEASEKYQSVLKTII